MKTTREFGHADRLFFDFGDCSSANGFAQLDTRQDACYFGTWANPLRLVIFNYCEGDQTTHQCDSEAEFVAEVRRIEMFNRDLGFGFGIDPGCNAELRQRFVALGLGDLIH
jgi:hypothetical protein